VYHYRFAKNIFTAGRRVAFDPLYDSGSPPGYFYNSEPLWHISLASLWQLFGKISIPVAQFYHTLYYALLILLTYLLGKELYGKEQGLYAALIVATIPAITSFSVLFYLDIPATTLSISCLFLIVKRKFFSAGIMLGLMYLTKRNSCFLAPAFFFVTLYQTEPRVRNKVKNLFFLFFLPFLFALPDFFWRQNNLKLTKLVDGRQVVVPTSGVSEYILYRLKLSDWSLRTSEHLNSSLFDPVDIVKYFGLVLLIALAMYVLLKIYDTRDLILWLPVTCYFLFFCYIFFPGSDIRYLLPIFPLLAVLSSKSITQYANRKWLKVSLVCLCLSQFGSTVLYVQAKRQLSRGIEEAFTYLRDSAAPDALIIYPEYVILEQANRRFAWAGNLHLVLKNLFWNKDENRVRDLLISNDVSYIAVKKARIYDDSKVHHFGGYPKSFVERLPRLSFLKLVFENKDIAIWYISDSSSESKG